MKSLRCSFGFHREFMVKQFPLKSKTLIIAGVQCDRCKRYRCVNQMYRPTMNDEVKLAFAQAKRWIEKVTGKRVTGPFVAFR